MKSSALKLILLLFLCSCVTNKEQDEISSFSLTIGSEEKIMRECEAIKETGNIFALLGEIKKDTKLVIQTLEKKPFKGMEDLIERLAENINQNSIRVIELSKGEWNDPDVRQSLKWQFSDSDFGGKNRYVSDLIVKAVYFLGKEEPGLINKVRIKRRGNDITVEYLNIATLLEYCQLNETLMIVLETNVHSFRRINKKFFNLNVNLEKLI